MRAITYLLMLIIHYTLANEPDYCFVHDDEPYLGFGTKTPYRFAYDKNMQVPTLPNCKPTQIWFMARHGTRYPQTDAVLRMGELRGVRWQIIHNHDLKKTGNLCDADLQNLRDWYPHIHFSLKYASKLTSEGWREGRELGERLKNVYPELLQVPQREIHDNNFVFRSAMGARSESSMYALMRGIFGSGNAVMPQPPPRRDALLRPDRHCPRWSHEKGAVDIERDGFIHGPEYAELQRNVSRRLGFNVSADTIHNMQDMCRFETAWTPGKISPWCAVFSNEEWKILEYIDDLQYYYSAGYGIPVNKLVGCYPMEDLFYNFRNLENYDIKGRPKAIFYFTTSRVLLDFIHTMDIAKDSKLLSASNYKEMSNRMWKTSVIASFNANFLATFYKCNDSHVSHKVTFHLGEKLVMYEGCENGVCDWEYLKKKLAKYAHHCAANCREIHREPPQEPRSHVQPELLHSDNQYGPSKNHVYFLLVITFFGLGFIFRRTIENILHRIIVFIWMRIRSRKFGENTQNT